MTDLPTKEKKVRECFHHMFYGVQCREPATWKGKGAGNATDHWTWCDKHVTDKEEYRERLP